MLRNCAVALILCCLFSPVALAIGLGPLQTSSALNENFSGRIEILKATEEDFDALKAGLASVEQFERAGVGRPPVLFGLRFAVTQGREGEKDFILVTSRDPIREPFLNFLVELSWPSGRMLREYTVLLDPPLYDPNKRPAPAPAPVSAPAQDVTPVEPASNETPVTAEDPATSTPSQPATSDSMGTVSGGEIGPVSASDTLWSLASTHRPSEDVSVQQTMLALLRTNPEAFRDANINMLQRGAILRMPSRDEIDSITQRDAIAEVRRQHQIWEDYRQQIGYAPTPQPVGTAPEPVVVDDSALESAAPDADADARLELAAPGDSAGGASESPGVSADGGGSELLREELDAQAQQNDELLDKLTEANGDGDTDD